MSMCGILCVWGVLFMPVCLILDCGLIFRALKSITGVVFCAGFWGSLTSYFYFVCVCYLMSPTVAAVGNVDMQKKILAEECIAYMCGFV